MAVFETGSTNSNANWNGANYKNYTLTNNGGIGNVLVVYVTINKNPTSRKVTTCTYDGVTMTPKYNIDRNGLVLNMAVFELINPPSGTNLTIRVSCNGGLWSPVSVNCRNYNFCGGIGNMVQVNGGTTPRAGNITVSQGSSVVMTSASTVSISQQKIDGVNYSYVQHNIYKYVTVTFLSTPLNAGNIVTEARCGSGSTVTNDMIELLSNSTPTPTQKGDFFLMM